MIINTGRPNKWSLGVRPITMLPVDSTGEANLAQIWPASPSFMAHFAPKKKKNVIVIITKYHISSFSQVVFQVVLFECALSRYYLRSFYNIKQNFKFVTFLPVRIILSSKLGEGGGGTKSVGPRDLRLVGPLAK